MKASNLLGGGAEEDGQQRTQKTIDHMARSTYGRRIRRCVEASKDSFVRASMTIEVLPRCFVSKRWVVDNEDLLILEIAIQVQLRRAGATSFTLHEPVSVGRLCTERIRAGDVLVL